MASKIIKNITISDIELEEVGVTIPASGQYEIQPEHHHRWAADDAMTEIIPYIDSGDLIVNDSQYDMTVANGFSLERAKDFLRYPDKAFNIRFLSEPERSNGFFAKNVQQAIEESRTTFEGKGFQVSYIGNGTVRNSWLQQEDQNIESNQSPDIFKFKARLVAIDFTNQNQNTDPIIKIAIRRYPYSNLNAIDESYKWTLTNARGAIKTDTINGFIVNPGDAMAVYCEDGGGNPNDLVITMDFIVLEAPSQELQFNYSGDFSSNDFPATALMTEIFE